MKIGGAQPERSDTTYPSRTDLGKSRCAALSARFRCGAMSPSQEIRSARLASAATAASAASATSAATTASEDYYTTATSAAPEDNAAPTPSAASDDNAAPTPSAASKARILRAVQELLVND
jgi:hypothetical protein